MLQLMLNRMKCMRPDGSGEVVHCAARTESLRLNILCSLPSPRFREAKRRGDIGL